MAISIIKVEACIDDPPSLFTATTYTSRICFVAAGKDGAPVFPHLTVLNSFFSQLQWWDLCGWSQLVSV